jgi:hypothetical protein
VEHSESIEFAKWKIVSLNQAGKKRRGIGRSDFIARANRTDVIVSGHDEENMSVVSSRGTIKVQS